MENRIMTLSSLLPDHADAALIISAENRRYFTDFVSSLGYLLVTRKKAFLFVDSRYEEAAGRQAKNCQVVPFRKLKNDLSDIIRTEGLHSVLAEGSAFTLNDAAAIEGILSGADAKLIKTNELDRLTERMRITKTSEETERIRQAQNLTENALRQTVRLIKEGVSERELALELEYRMRRSGADGVSFDLIVLTGEATSMPHGVPSDRRVKNGDFILFDIGATVDGYHSDMTRTFAYGAADSTMKRIYQTVLTAQTNAISAVRSGISCGLVDSAARDYISHAGFGEYFGHSTGHGVGLNIHEAPSVSPGSEVVLESGMVVTVEPGIYLPGKFGVRIEDMVVVTKDGCIDLTAYPKELTVL